MPSEARFSRAQKWDLVRMSAAAVASTVFFTVPLFLVRPNPSAQRSPEPPTPVAAPAIPAVSLDSQPAPPAEIAPPAVIKTVSVVTATELAPESTPVLQPVRAEAVLPRTHAQRSPVVSARANVKTNPAQSSFKHRLARFFSGVGKYAVKPFPTVTTSEN